ncbi:cysteine desulfurase family protein [Merismopedia glauca]|uniref:cysteine desulfurase n=1 Tax=Merismopedia glauca CCAP 1448/3 TaxID=1296344 RepID=A0A2T1C4I2_9CYAN|nr:cysteine desulfurase family protein [Merismopedia glauca]PSB03192.1 cysteine desulfurase [Merismopedia glauca CCAP 1448/3]
MQIYLDYSATTPTRPEAIAIMQQVMTHQWGNPSSLHQWGERSTLAIETARSQVANLINAPDPDSIIFTSGGTEANNMAIMGIAHQYSTPQHLIISSVEHSAIAEPAAFLERLGWEITRLPVDAYGRVNPRDLELAIQPNTVLISIIYGQSEIGTVQPIAELSQIAQAYGVKFHTDAVQVAGRLPINVQQLGVDLLSMSSHKIYGPQGVGALYIRPGVKISPLMGGGGQERGMRSGTQAVPIIAGFGIAAELAQTEMETSTSELLSLRDSLFSQLNNLPCLLPTGHLEHRLPHHVSFAILPCFPQCDSEPITGRTIVRQMNLAGIAISAGSACHSGKTSPSPVLLAMGLSPAAALGGIRFTLGKHTTQADIDWTAMVLKQVLERLMPVKVTMSCR